MDRLYSDLLWELGKLAQAGGTAVGATAVAKRVALEHGIASAEHLPLPRLNRAELMDMSAMWADVDLRRKR